MTTKTRTNFKLMRTSCNDSGWVHLSIRRVLTKYQDADEITKKMTKDEYVHYSDCRQASFTYRKGGPRWSSTLTASTTLP